MISSRYNYWAARGSSATCDDAKSVCERGIRAIPYPARIASRVEDQLTYTAGGRAGAAVSGLRRARRRRCGASRRRPNAAGGRRCRCRARARSAAAAGVRASARGSRRAAAATTSGRERPSNRATSARGMPRSRTTSSMRPTSSALSRCPSGSGRPRAARTLPLPRSTVVSLVHTMGGAVRNQRVHLLQECVIPHPELLHVVFYSSKADCSIARPPCRNPVADHDGIELFRPSLTFR